MEESQAPAAKRQRTLHSDSASSSLIDADDDNDDKTTPQVAAVMGIGCKPSALGTQNEHAVGIQAFMRQGNQFFGVLKARFSDFLVREVTPEGKVVRLTNCLDIPPDILAYEDKIRVHSEQLNTPEARDDSLKRLTDILGEEVASEVLSFLSTAPDPSSSSASSSSSAASSGTGAALTIAVPSDKETRRGVHQCIRELSGGSVASETSPDGENLILKRIKAKGGRGAAVAPIRQNRQKWPQELPQFIHFTLYKANVDTNMALVRLGGLIGCGTRPFAVAGTKDKRGVTCQRVSVHHGNVRNLLKANQQFEKDQRQSTLRLSDFALSDVPLRLGDLWGNYFEIVIREVTGSDHELAVAALNLQRHGFINYFGMQRFGSGYEEAGTHKVGVTLMRGEWKQAFDLILAPQPHENAELRAAREHYTVRHDIHSALRALPHTCHMEKGLLTALLKNNSTGYFNAITAALPRNLRLMYVHAWQSWVWNTMVTKRLTTLGKHLLVVGDLVIPFSSYKGASPEDPEAPSSCTPVLIEDEATLAQYSIEDLVMPLPGVDVIYPTHSCGFEAYSEMLTSQGLDIRDLHRPQKDLTLSGGYRHVVTIPKDFGYSIFYYDDPHADLMLSDLEILRQRPRPDPAVLRRFKAVSLQFRLPSASYATMFIREFTMLSSTELR